MYLYTYHILLIYFPNIEHHSTHTTVNNRFDTVNTLFTILVQTLIIYDFQRLNLHSNCEHKLT